MESYINASSTQKFSEFCSAINITSNCFSELIFSECVPETLQFVFDHTNEYLKGFTFLNSYEIKNTTLNNTEECHLITQNVAVQTGCQEDDVIKFLECEQIVDKFQFQPVSFLRNSTDWKDFCHIVGSRYQQCHDSMTCHFEPVTSATRTLYDNLCNRPVTHRDQIRFSDCLNDVTSSSNGQLCLQFFRSVDLLAKNSGTKICHAIEEILNCTAESISKKCGDEALLHVYDTHNSWMNAFNTSCILHPPNFVTKETSIETVTEVSSTHKNIKLIEQLERSPAIETNLDETKKQTSEPIQKKEKDLVLIIGESVTETSTMISETSTTTSLTSTKETATTHKGIIL